MYCETIGISVTMKLTSIRIKIMRIDRIMAFFLGLTWIILGGIQEQKEIVAVGLFLFGMSLCFENKD